MEMEMNDCARGEYKTLHMWMDECESGCGTIFGVCCYILLHMYSDGHCWKHWEYT